MSERRFLNIVYTIFYILIFGVPILFILIAALQPTLEDMQLNPFDHARITDMEYRAVLEDPLFDETVLHVTEKMTFDVRAASRDNLYWELWRDLSEEETDGLTARYEVKSVTEILPDGTRIPYPESDELYWEDWDYTTDAYGKGPGKWYHSPGPYNESRRRYEAVFFYVDGLFREKVTFEIEYDLYNVVLKYADCCDLYLIPYYGHTITYLDSFYGEILIPDLSMPAKGNYEVFTYGTRAKNEAFEVKESDTKYPGYYTFTFDLDEEDLKFTPSNQYIEFELVAFGEDYDAFAESAPDNYYSHTNALEEIFAEHEEYVDMVAQYKVKKAVAFGICVAIAILLLIMYLRTDKSIQSKHIFYEPEAYYDFYREIPGDLDPYFAAALAQCKHKKIKDDSHIYSALLLSLAQKEYVALTDLGDDVEIRILRPANAAQNSASNITPDTFVTNDQYIMYTEDTPAELTVCETYYFNLLVRHTHGDRIMMSTFRRKVTTDFSNTADFADNMANAVVNIGVANGYFQKAEYDQIQKKLQNRAKFLLWTGIILLLPVNLISYFTRMDLSLGGYTLLGAVCVLFAWLFQQKSYHYPLLTDLGETEYAKWRGLYNYLSSKPLMTENTILDLAVWERYLVYATAFGLSDKINEAIKIRCPQFTYNEKYRDSGYQSKHFYHRTGRRFRSSVRTGTYNNSSYSYGGSGRYGGGGGGGH